jgi:hypothetical protein
MRWKKMADYFGKWYTLHLSQIAVHKVINKFTLLFDSASYNAQQFYSSKSKHVYYFRPETDSAKIRKVAPMSPIV